MTSVGIIIRLYNEEPIYDRAIKMAQAQTHKPINVRVHVDEGSTDHTLELVKQLPGIILDSYPRRTTWDATKRAIGQSNEDVLLFFDADNIMPADRVEKQLALHPIPPPFCTGNVRITGNVPREFVLPNTMPLDFNSLFRGNCLDLLTFQMNGQWARETILPLMERADTLTPGLKMDDYFMVMVAARTNNICHHDLIVGEYVQRVNSETNRRGPKLSYEVDIRTRQAIQALIDEKRI